MRVRRAAILGGTAAIAAAAAVLVFALGGGGRAPAREELAETVASDVSLALSSGLGAAGGAMGGACRFAWTTRAAFGGLLRPLPFRAVHFPAAEGEKLLYSVSWLGIRAGTVEFRVGGRELRDGAECVLVEMTMTSTNALVDAVYPVRERALSRVDASGTFSRGYEIDRLHRGVPVRDEQSFDYARGVSECLTVKRRKTDRCEVSLPGPVQDSISWVYYVRACVAAGDSSARFTMVQRSKRWAAELAIEGAEEIELGARGRVRALRARGGAGLAGIFGREPGEAEGVSLWFEPASGILLSAQAKAPVGEMRLELARRTGEDDGRNR